MPHLLNRKKLPLRGLVKQVLGKPLVGTYVKKNCCCFVYDKNTVMNRSMPTNAVCDSISRSSNLSNENGQTTWSHDIKGKEHK